MSIKSISHQDAKNKIRYPDFSWPWSVSSILDFEVFIGYKTIQNELKELVDQVSLQQCK